jgi:transposase
VDGIMARAVARGLERREVYLPTMLGVDETSFERRHEYVTVVSDQVTGAVVHVADGRYPLHEPRLARVTRAAHTSPHGE